MLRGVEGGQDRMTVGYQDQWNDAAAMRFTYTSVWLDFPIKARKNLS